MRKALDPAPADALAVVFSPDPSFVHPFAVARASGTLDLRADHSEASGKQSLHLDTNSLELIYHVAFAACKHSLFVSAIQRAADSGNATVQITSIPSAACC